MCQRMHLLAIICAIALAACGGGGGAGSAPTKQTAVSQSYQSALNFDSPDTFVNGRSYTTTQSIITVSGELNSVNTPSGYCPGTLPQNHSVRWRNQATGETDTVPVAIRCVTSNLFGQTSDGVTSAFFAESITLTPGRNTIVFETFEGDRKVGEDTVVIFREDRTAPTVSFVYPVADEPAVPPNHGVLVVFSEAMDEATLSPGAFSLIDSNGNPVYGALAYDPRHFAWHLQPDEPLRPGERYTVTVGAEVKDAGGGNPFGGPLTWSFTGADTTDESAPILDQRWPGPACDCAPVFTRILVRFNEPLLPASVGASSVTLRDESGQLVPGTTVYAGDYLEFVPEAALSSGATYQVSMAAGLQDLVGTETNQVASWQFTVDIRVPAGRWVDIAVDQQVLAMSGHTGIWTYPEVLFWSGSSGAGYDVAGNAWRLLSLEGAPSTRRDHSAVWTGSDMIVWGGQSEGAALGSGGRYDPIADAWQTIPGPTSSDYRATYGHVAVWAAGEMLVWGGFVSAGSNTGLSMINRGWRYDPGSDAWASMSVAGSPSARVEPLAVWTGKELLIWGGSDSDGNLLNDGARYDPVTDVWTPISDEGAPHPNGYGTAGVWTGTELIVWNGGALHPDQRSNTGFRQPTLHLYDPDADAWRVSQSGWEPLLISRTVYDEPLGVSLHWTGERMIAMGAWPFVGIWLYDPFSDRWQELNRADGRFGYRGAAEIWTGDRLVIWGGTNSVLPTNTGKVFLP